MHFVYILKSQAKQRFYIGCTKDLSKRIKEHNSGKTSYKARYAPWELVCFREFEHQLEAYQCEKLIKSYKGGNSFKKIISGEVPKWLKGRVC